jgi:hypothetical protein
VREQLAALRAQRRQRSARPEKREAETVAGQPLRDVAAIDETQLQHSERPAAPHAERTRVEPPHEPAPNAEIDDDSDPETHADVLHAERARRQEHEGRVIAWCGPP